MKFKYAKGRGPYVVLRKNAKDGQIFTEKTVLKPGEACEFDPDPSRGVMIHVKACILVPEDKEAKDWAKGLE